MYVCVFGAPSDLAEEHYIAWHLLRDMNGNVRTLLPAIVFPLRRRYATRSNLNR